MTLPNNPLRRELRQLAWAIERAILACREYEELSARFRQLDDSVRRAILAQMTPRDLSDVPPDRYAQVREYLDMVEAVW